MGIAQVEGLLDVEVTLEPYAGQDAHGTSSYGSAVTVKARIEQSTRWIPGPNGQSLASSFKVILGQPVTVDPRDRLTLPAAFGTRDVNGDFEQAQPPILSVSPVYYRGQHDHTVVYLR